MGRGFSGVVLSLLLAGVLLVTVELRFVNAYVEVYIKADGSIDPPSAPISTTDNITYTFTGNITGSVTVQRNNTIINGNAHTLEIGGYGFVLSHVRNVTIENTTISSPWTSPSGIQVHWSSGCTITGNVMLGYYMCGVYIYHSSNNTVSRNRLILPSQHYLPPPSPPSAIQVDSESNYNTICMNNVTAQTDCGISIVGGSAHNNVSGNSVSKGRYGILLWTAQDSILRENNITGNIWNFDVDGGPIDEFINDVDASNRVNGKRVYYWINKHDAAVPSDGGTVILVNCTRITVEGLDLVDNGNGVLLAYTTDVTVKCNNIRHNFVGVRFQNSTGNLLYGNNITENYYRSFYLEGSPGNRAYHNNCDPSGYIETYEDSLDMLPDSLPLVPPLYDRWCLGGNYWFSCVGQDHFSGYNNDQVGNDGIGDEPIWKDFFVDWRPLIEPWTPHNVAAVNIRPFRSTVAIGTLLQIDALVINRGDYDETFNVTLYANTTAIDRKQMTLNREGYAYAILTWNTTGFTEYGNYTLCSSALNNDNVGGTVVLAHEGDINGDGKVDIKDLAKVSAAFGSVRMNNYLDSTYSSYLHPTICPTCPHTPNADLNGDNKVDIQDLSRTSANFGWHR